MDRHKLRHIPTIVVALLILRVTYTFYADDTCRQPVGDEAEDEARVEEEFKAAVARGCAFPHLDLYPDPLTNYEMYPCLPGTNPSHRLQLNGKCVRTVNFPKDLLRDKTGCMYMKTGELSTIMCLHSIEIDAPTLNKMIKVRTTEGGLVSTMTNVLEKDPDMVFIDGGCNVGIYTLAAALRSNRVICIDANYENLYLVSKSLTLGFLWENATLIWNAFSDRNKKVVLHRKQSTNIGSMELDSRITERYGCDIAVNAIILDDLKDLVVNKRVYMKLDLQGQEHNCLGTGSEFFKMADVRYVQVEYDFHKGRASGKDIVDTMASYGLRGYTNCNGNSPLNDTEEKRWPMNVCFIKK